MPVRALSNVVERWARRDVAVALARIGAGAYSAATFAYYVTVSPKVLDRGVVHNALDDAEQRGLTKALAVAMVLALVLVATLVFRGRRESPSERWRRLVDGSFAPFLLAPLGIWPLCEAAGPYYLHVVAITAMSALFGFALHSFAMHAPRAQLLEVLEAPRFTRAAPLLVLAIGVAHGILLATIAVSRIQTLASGWDLAIFAQVTWNIAHGGVPSSSMYFDEPINHYGVHFSPTHHVVALLYWARPTPTTLVVLSNLGVGIAALPAYLLGKQITGRTTIGFLLGIGYLSGRRDRYGDRADRIRSAIEQIPPGACVRATTPLLVPLSGRKGTYVVESLSSGDFGVVYVDDRVVLIGRGKPTTQNAELLERLRRLDAETVAP
jgi:hypothetical protein